MHNPPVCLVFVLPRCSVRPPGNWNGKTSYHRCCRPLWQRSRQDCWTWCCGGGQIQTALVYCAGLEEKVRCRCMAAVSAALPCPPALGHRSMTKSHPATGTTHFLNIHIMSALGIKLFICRYESSCSPGRRPQKSNGIASLFFEESLRCFIHCINIEKRVKNPTHFYCTSFSSLSRPISPLPSWPETAIALVRGVGRPGENGL